MLINWAATKAKFDQKFNQSAIARGMGLPRSTFCRIITGEYPYMDSARGKAVIAKLEELEVLVRITPVEETESAAA
ncbi:MAG: hypothetical protein A2075_09290 [Geobacteraceae bacterium GWC2_58_44]|nr:MAG: hypothetical protein A2075_09290 [Geobacteraceae bacterium GWC2_58_44]HBG07707.1 hypothetical protein [Geobacter sp.]